MRTVPAQKPATSKQDYQTDPAFIRAVVKRWGPLSFDLAAHSLNTQCPRFYYSKEQNSLVQDWGRRLGNLWLNPPFADIEPWAAKCSRTKLVGSRILFLTPAAVSTNWFAEHVFGHARVFAVRPRLTFVGQTTGFPKDMILSVFGEEPAFCCWRWDR